MFGPIHRNFVARLQPNMEDFVHLHVHSQYSILDGQASIGSLLKKAIADGMQGMALTDHGNMMGVKEFYNEAKKAIGKAKESLKKAQEEGESEEQIAKLQRAAAFKPILGCEMYVARRTLKDKKDKTDQSGHHLIVLAKNSVGYHNLIKLVSKAWVDGFYMRPRTDHEELAKYREGLIVCSACLGGEIPSNILKDDIDKAKEAARWFKSIFGDDYYLELQRHEVKDPSIQANREVYGLQTKVNEVLIQLAKELDIKLICSNDVHFVNEEDGEAHDRLICLSTGKDLDDPKRLLYTKQEWFKTQREMNKIFEDIPEAMRNTIEICNKVELYSIDHAPIMPNFPIPESFGTEEEYRSRLTEEDLFNEFTRDENGKEIVSREEGLKKIEKLGGFNRLYRIKFEADYLAKLAYDGAKRRYGEPLSDEVKERVNFELHIMKVMGFPGYFLIVQDYINTARNELGVSVGPGRGSAAGSAVAYCLGITQIDPIKYDLLFERFLNPDRISLPDIDVDFDDDGRGRVLQWVTDKYGAENCAHIITYGTMATKSAIKDVARVERLPLSESNRLCKLIPDKLPEDSSGKSPKLTLDNAIAAIPGLREAEASDNPLLRDTIRYARQLEGNVRNTGVHACGFIICKDKISDWVPISTADDKETGEKLRCTQYEGRVIEETGLIKMDFLGLKNLSIIKEALENIKLSLGIDLDIDKIDISDKATYQLFSDGNTIGTFQFESTGMQGHLRNLQPSTFEDLIAMNALYRPGPMQYIPKFIQRKKGEETITYDLPCMEKYLKETYGITVYQEQVMLLSREIANFTRGESDTLRKAMGKKLIDKLNHMYPKFISGGKANGYDEKILEKIWDDWKAFASYAFNKSHATCYSWIAYQTGYLKANYPSQYMAGAMSRALSNITEITKFMDESKRMGINTLGPDINESLMKFSVNHRGDIRFGLGAIKGVGSQAVENILKEREVNGQFSDIYNVMERINLTTCNRKTLENLAIAGAFDSFGIAREQFVEIDESGGDFLDALIRYGTQYKIDQSQAQNSLFGEEAAAIITKPLPAPVSQPWTNLERLNKERDLIGIYISGHPLDKYKIILNKVCTTTVADLDNLNALADQDISFGGIVTDTREGMTKRDKPYGVIKLEDYKGAYELMFWGDDWARLGKQYNTKGNFLYIRAHVTPRRFKEGEYDLRYNEISFLSDARERLLDNLTITLNVELFSAAMAEELCSLIQREAGKTDLKIVAKDLKGRSLSFVYGGSKIAIDNKLTDFLDNCEAINYTIN